MYYKSLSHNAQHHRWMDRQTDRHTYYIHNQSIDQSRFLMVI